MALTPSEAQGQAIKLLGMDDRLRQDPEMRLLYGIKQKHALYDTVFELMGVKDSTKFMGSPDDPQVQQQAKQMAMQQQQQQQKQDQMVQFNMGMMADQSAQNWAKINNDIMDDQHDNRLDDRKFSTDTFFRQEELDLERSQQRGVNLQG